MDKWHVGRAGQTFGPFPWAQVAEMARTGRLAPVDMLWQEGTAGWVPASTYAATLPFPPGAAGPAPPPLPPQPGVAAVKARAAGTNLLFHAGRATEWNLHNLKVTDDETRELLALGVNDEDARKFTAWRRSVLILTFWAGIVAASLGTILAGISENEQTKARQAYQEAQQRGDPSPPSIPLLADVGHTLVWVRVMMLWVIPFFARSAAKSWTRHKRSRRTLSIGWTISFITPLFLALIPSHWQYDMTPYGDAANQAVQYLRLGGAIVAYLTLMPAVLALIPGIMRASLRIKILLPQSIVPGWFLVGVAPFWMFLFMVVFVTINQVAGDWLLILAITAITLAPILYLLNVAVFTRPIMSPDDQKRLLQIQRQVRLILTVGVILMVIWLFTGEVFGKRIIGLEEGTSLMRPWDLDLFRFPVEFATHSLFTMALAADLFMAMNLSVWQYTKEFVATPAARDYDRRMAEIEEAGEKE